MRRSVWFVASFPLLACGLAWFAVNEDQALAQAPVPVVSAAVTGPKQVVFDSQNGCEKADVPDAPARAFRDAKNIVHLVAANVVARAMTGPDLDHLKRECRAVYHSPQGQIPQQFHDSNWLYSFYTADGRRIAALVQNELSGSQIPGVCDAPGGGSCDWNTVAFAQSVDGGDNFAKPAPPGNLVAAVPWRVSPGGPRAGYRMPTNIVKVGTSYYALINSFPFKTQKAGACLIRTPDVFDAKAWRAWDGSGFNVRFADPHRETIAKPQEHICQPVTDGIVESLVQIPHRGNFIITLFSAKGYEGPPGFYIQASRDLMHWSKPSLVIKLADLVSSDGPGKWTYEYASLLDPGSFDRNFSSVSETPYLYYVRFDANRPSSTRALLRRQIKLQFGS